LEATVVFDPMASVAENTTGTAGAIVVGVPVSIPEVLKDRPAGNPGAVNVNVSMFTSLKNVLTLNGVMAVPAVKVWSVIGPLNTGAALATVIVISNVLDGVPVPEPVRSVAVTVTDVTDDVPVTVGLPVRTPAVLRLRPAGNVGAVNVSGSELASKKKPLRSRGTMPIPSG